MRLAWFIALTVTFAGTALADRYWVAYEGDDLPENEGWSRGTGAGGAIREIESGVLELNGLGSDQIYDYYEHSALTALSQDEFFLFQWRVRVAETHGGADISLAISADDRYSVGFRLTESSIRSVFGVAMTVDFQSGVFHHFELLSADMRSFLLYIDNEIAMVGSFSETASSSRVAWGDGVQGAASLSQWDYVRFGVVPEPNPGVMLLVTPICLIAWRRR